MASPIPGSVGRLDVPPPSPVNPPGSDAPPTPPGAGAQGSPNPTSDSPTKAVAAIGMSIDQALSQLSKVATGSTPEFAQARKLVQKGIAKILQQTQATGGSPTSVGPQFTGGGIAGAM